DALHLVFGYRRERRVVAVKEREADVLITHKQRWPSIFRVAFAKTEDALICALPRDDLLKHQAEIFTLFAVEFDIVRFAVRFLDLKCQFRLTAGLKSKIEIIAHRPPVHACDPIIWT